MYKVMEWLEDEANGLAILGYVVLAAVLVVAFQQMVHATLENWHIIVVPTATTHEEFLARYPNPFKYMGRFEFADIVAMSPLFEESLFRLLPLAFVIMFVSTRPMVVFTTTLCLAVLFGAIHPYDIYGRAGVAIAGIFFGTAFLKCGGMKKRFVKGWFCAVTAHGISNLFVLLYGLWEHFVMNGT